jgi:alpha-glucosidase
LIAKSPLGVSDSPDNYRGQSGFDFVQSVSATWNETRGISGALGDHVVIARRKGRDWCVGAMTNEQGRTVSVPLSFLGTGKWTATAAQDGSSPMEVVKASLSGASHGHSPAKAGTLRRRGGQDQPRH